MVEWRKLSCEYCGAFICWYVGWNDGDIQPFCPKCVKIRCQKDEVNYEIITQESKT